MPAFTPDPYLTAAQVRTRISRGGPALSSTEFPDTWVDETVEVWEGMLEDHKGVAYTTRETVETVRVPGYTDRLKLKWPKVQSIVSLVIDGTTIAADLYSIEEELGRVLYPSRFAPSVDIVVTYQHGYEATPALVKQATALFVEREASADRSGATRDYARLGFDGGSSTIPIRTGGDNLTAYGDVNDKIRPLISYRSMGAR